jgi:hypothetical protein
MDGRGLFGATDESGLFSISYCSVATALTLAALV